MSDDDRIATAIAFIAQQVDRQPTLDEMAAHVHLSPCHFQRLFSRWAGITPKRFLQVLTLEHAKRRMNDPASLLEIAESVGLSSGSRLYDHFVHLEAVTPGEYRRGGAGLIVRYGVHDTPFGSAFVATTARGIYQFGFVDHQPEGAALRRLDGQWPQAELRMDPIATMPVIQTMFRQVGGRPIGRCHFMSSAQTSRPGSGGRCFRFHRVG